MDGEVGRRGFLRTGVPNRGERQYNQALEIQSQAVAWIERWSVEGRVVSQILPLELLQAGETGRVLEVSGSAPVVVRLEEMGLRSGVQIRMVQPGQPCIVALDHQRLSFRGEEAAVVLVEVTEG